MKFLCVSDQIDPLVYSTSVKERYGNVDAVFCAGDLSMDYVDFIVSAIGRPTFFVFGNHNLEEYKYYNNKNQEGPASPHEQTDFSHSHGADYASNRIIRDKRLKFTLKNGKTTPLLIAGVSGSLKYNNGLCQFTDFQMKCQLLKLIPGLLWNKIRYGRYCDIFLTHASPRHIHDKEDPCHKGFQCFNWFIRKFSPSILIHGHIHLYDLQAKRCTQCGSTAVINAYSHILVELKEPNLIKKSRQKGEDFVQNVFTIPD